MRVPLLIVAGGLTLAPAGLAGQTCVSGALGELDRAATRADSLALVDRFRAAPPADDRRCADLLDGILVGLTSTPAEDEWRERQRASDLLDAALRYAPDEPRLYLAMANLLYNRQARTDAARMIDRALDRRDRGAPLRPRELAFAHYLRGLMHADAWRDWRSYGQLVSASEGQWRCSRSETTEAVSFSSTSNDHTWLLAVNQLCPELFAENMGRYFETRAGLKRDELDHLEAAFARALAADSTYFPAAEALLGEWAYLREWEKAGGLARTLQGRAPDDYRPHLYLGLVEHEAGRDSLAALEFGKALLSMPDSLVTVFDDVSPLLLPQQAAWLAEDTARAGAFRAAFWNSLDPLYLTTANERKLEHYARIVAADLMFTSPALRERGSQSFAGQIWIRYGRPRHMWELQVPAGRVVFWDYGPGPDVTFTRGTAYRSYRPSDEAIEYATKLSRVTPQTYSAAGVVDTVSPLTSQLVRVLGDEHRPEILVSVAWPGEVMAGNAVGLTLLDAMFQPVAQWRGRVTDRPGLATELTGLAGGTYSLTVEVWDRGARHLHRYRDTVSTLVVEDSSFAVSDLLLVGSLTPPADGDATSRRALAPTPLYGGTVGVGEPVGLVWETYRLAGDRNGRLRYRVSVEVLDAGRQPVLARVLRGVGLAGERRPETRIEYDSNRPLADGRAVEWLELTSELKPGEYRVVLRLRDQASGREVVRERTLTVR